MIKVILFLLLSCFASFGQTYPSGYNSVCLSGSDQTTTSATFVDVTGLSFPVSSGTYQFWATIGYTTNATTTGGGFSVNCSVAVSNLFALSNASTSASAFSPFAFDEWGKA